MLKKIIFLQIIICVLLTTSEVKAQVLEKKIDKFYNDLIVGIKEVKSEKQDELAVAKLKKIKANLLPRAEQLQAEIENHINTLNDDQIQHWDDMLKDKPYNKEIFDLTFDIAFIERINRNTEFESAYNDIIDLSDKVMEVEFAEPVDPSSQCSVTLNGGRFKNQIFNLPPSGMKSAEAFSDQGEFVFDIEGYSGKNLIGISFITGNDKPGVYKWKGEYSLTLTYFDGTNELVLGGHQEKGSVTLKQVEEIGGWVSGEFEGKLQPEESKQMVEVKGTFKVRRNIGPE